MHKKSIVYSTDLGRICPDCSRPVADCACKNEKPPTAGDGIVRLQRQSKGRSGKPVTLIKGLGLDRTAMKSLCKTLKVTCGVGGSCIDDDILIQGDMRERLVLELKKLGFNVR